MKGQAKSNSDSTSQFLQGVSVLVDPYKRAQIKRISQQLLSPQAKKAEDLLFNLMGFTAIRFARGMRPQLHEMRNRWSKPVYLFFASATIINLLGTALCTYDFMSKADDQLHQIVDISKKNQTKLKLRYNQANQTNTSSIDSTKTQQRKEQLNATKSQPNQ